MHRNDTKIFGSNQYDLNRWDTINITDMERMFIYAENFNNIHSLPISISQIESDYMNGVGLHNQPLNFDTSKVINMFEMFRYVRSFNQPLNWNTSEVTNMNSMFYFADSFNQELSSSCVYKISPKPTDFDYYTPAWVKINRQPKWGQWGNCL